MSEPLHEFFRLIMHPVKSRMFLLSKLPSAYFAGVRIKNISETSCQVSIPYKWFSQNPFRSTYFACLSMAAEMSTGALAMAYLYKRKPAVSMLVTRVESSYEKKATGLTVFTCEEGHRFREVIEEAIRSSEPRTINARSIGRNEIGEVVAVFTITWSFKARNPKNDSRLGII